jgi:hypothetical protein
MKRQLLSILFCASLMPASSATLDTYINNGIVTAVFPPVPAPDIDATNFVNNGFFGITNFFTENFFTPPEPFVTANTLNYSNRNRMLGDSGFRFNFFDQNNSGLNFRANNFVNANNVNETNANIYGATYVLVAATNIINRGTLAIGGAGLMNLSGDNVDLVRSTLGAFGNETNVIAGVLDRYWGVETNTFGGGFNQFTPASPFVLVTMPFFQTYFRTFQSVVLDQGFTAYIQITPTGPNDQVVDVLLLSQTNAAITTEVRFGFPTVNGSEKVVKWSAVVTNRVTGALSTNELYLDDALNFFASPFPDPNLLQSWLVQTFRPNFFFTFFSAATFHPINYQISRSFPFFTNLTLIQPSSFDSSIFFGTNFPVWVTNTAYGATLTANAFGPDLSITGSTYTNIPGRIQIHADKVLDLTRTRIDGQSYLRLESTNHFVGSVGAAITAPFSDIRLATTNSTLTISNLTAPFIARMAGEIDVWSGRWTNTDANGFVSTYSMTMVDSRLVPFVPSQIQDLLLRATNLFISDAMNVFGNLLLDTERLTVTTNLVNAPTAFGEINLTSGDIWWSASTPRLQFLTNYGKISSSNTIYFGGARRPPFFTGTFDEPYQAFVNYGLISSHGNDTWANYYQFSGTNLAGNGPIRVRANTASITNGAFIATEADISLISDTLIISNMTLIAGHSINLSVSTVLTDGNNLTNANIWQTSDGFNLLVKPVLGDLLVTTITNKAFPNANVINRSAAEDRGCSPAGFQNNGAIGRLILDGGQDSVFTFSAVGPANAIYIDYLELDNFATNRDDAGNLVGVNIDPNMKVYFGQAVAAGVSIAEKITGLNDGRLCWVSDYNCGFFSSTNILYPNGTTNRVNTALAQSCTLDSNGNGVVNCMDPAPIPGGGCPFLLPPGVPIIPGGTNLPPDGGSTNNPVPSTASLPVRYVSGSDAVLPDGLLRAQGTYSGLFYDTNELAAASSGYFTAKTTSKGTFSGKLLLSGRSYAFSGLFDATGHATKTIPRAGAPALTLNLQLDLSGGDQVRGQVSGGTWTAHLMADRLVTLPARRSSQPGDYALVIPGTLSSTKEPNGAGFGTVKVSTGGTLIWSGSLADGTKVTQSSAISKQGYWPLYLSLYGGTGTLVSWVQFVTQTNSDLGGYLIWIKPAGAHRYYPQGFTNEVTVTGSSYRAPSSGARALNLTEGNLVLRGGGLEQPLYHSLTLGLNNRVTPATGVKLTLSLTPTTGLFKGTAAHPSTGKPLPFQGILFKKANIGIGYFLDAEQSGEVYLGPAP